MNAARPSSASRERVECQRVTRAVLISYTALTFVAYFAIAGAGALNPIGLSDKTVEAALIALLIIDGRRARA